MQSIVEGVLAFLEANPEWVFAIAFAMGAIETMIVVSLFFPSTLILVGAGALVATDEVTFWPLFLGATAGAIAGSSLAWWLGWRFHEPVLRWKPFAKRKQSINRMRKGVRKYGLWCVFFGHFLPPLRGPIFLLVGASNVPYRAFLPVTAAGALIWGFLTPLVGSAGGHVLEWLFS